MRHFQTDEDLEAIEEIGRLVDVFVSESVSLARRNIRKAWLRARFFTGRWRGIMIQADHAGKLQPEFHAFGLNIHVDDPEFRIEFDGEEALSICPKVRS